jgi:hypothetical protein
MPDSFLLMKKGRSPQKDRSKLQPDRIKDLKTAYAKFGLGPSWEIKQEHERREAKRRMERKRERLQAEAKRKRKQQEVRCVAGLPGWRAAWLEGC